MNLIRGLDRIIFISALLVFLIGLVSFYEGTAHVKWWANPNPEYEAWYKEHGAKCEEILKDPMHPINPFPPPDKYLPLEIHKRVILAILLSLLCSVIWIFGLAALARTVKHYLAVYLP